MSTNLKGFSNRFFSGKILIAFSAVLLLVTIFSACKKDNTDQPNIPAAGLMTFNLAPDRSSVGFTLSNSLINNTPLNYTGYSGGYQSIYVGNRAIESFDFQKDTTLAKSALDFQKDKYYSLFLVGNNGVYRNVTVNDDVDSLKSTSKAYVRYINAIPDSTSPVVTISSNGSNAVNAAAKYPEMSPFVEVAGGSVNVAVNNGSNISASRTVTLENGKIYTVLLVGNPGATDTTKAVQVRFILNGSVTAE